MRVLSASDLLEMWERGRDGGGEPCDPATALLAAALPELPSEQLAVLPLGRRDALLLRVRERLFGRQLQACASCPACQSRVEFALDGAVLREETAGPLPPPEGYTLARDEYELRFRLPTGRDLAAAAACREVAAGRARLLQLCVLEAERSGVAVPPESLPDSLVAEVAARMAEYDPQAETVLDLRCPACDHQWAAQLDIAAFVWAEVAAQARRLLREVDALARAYGWREADILAMSALRRQSYLEMVW